MTDTYDIGAILSHVVGTLPMQVTWSCPPPVKEKGCWKTLATELAEETVIQLPICKACNLHPEIHLVLYIAIHIIGAPTVMGQLKV